jgi:hypothetical protein
LNLRLPFSPDKQERGAIAGDLVMIGDLDFDYTPSKVGAVPLHLIERDAEIAKRERARAKEMGQSQPSAPPFETCMFGRFLKEQIHQGKREGAPRQSSN